MIAWSFSLRNHPLGQGLGITSTTNICARFMGTSNVPSATCRQGGPSSVSQDGKRPAGVRNPHLHRFPTFPEYLRTNSGVNPGMEPVTFAAGP